MVCAPTSCPLFPQQPLLTHLPDTISQDVIHRINTARENMARRLRLWRNASRPCFLPSKRWPVLSFNTSLTRTQHDDARSQAPPLSSCSWPDVQQPLRPGKESQSRPWHTKLNPDDNLAAREVQEGSRAPKADLRDVPDSKLPFICDECGSIFRNEQGLHDHHYLNKSQQSIWGQEGGCKNRIPVAGTKVGSNLFETPGIVFLTASLLLNALYIHSFIRLASQVNPHVLKVQDPRDLRFTVGIGDKIFEIPSRDLKPSTVAISQDSGYQVVSTFNAKSETTSSVCVPGQSHATPSLHPLGLCLLFGQN